MPVWLTKLPVLRRQPGEVRALRRCGGAASSPAPTRGGAGGEPHGADSNASAPRLTTRAGESARKKWWLLEVAEPCGEVTAGAGPR